MSKINFNALADFFAADRNVVMATVFGSAANGEVRPGGDLDLGCCSTSPRRRGCLTWTITADYATRFRQWKLLI